MIDNHISHGARSSVSEQELAVHMRQTFNYMTGGVAISGLVAWLTLNNPEMLAMAAKSSWVFFAIWIAFGFFMHKIIFNMQPAAALGVFAAFSALTGFSLAPLAYVYTGESITIAFVLAAVMFGGASLYGYVSKKSLSSWGTFLMMGCLGLFAAIIINIFVGSEGASFLISLIAVGLISAVTAYEVNQTKEMYAHFSSNEVMRSRMAVYGATSLYMNFVVIFIHLLNLLGNRE